MKYKRLDKSKPQNLIKSVTKKNIKIDPHSQLNATMITSSFRVLLHPKSKIT